VEEGARAGAVQADVVEDGGAACVVEGLREVEAGIVVDGGVVVMTGAEGSKQAGVERARGERRRTLKAIRSEAILN
jgi:hypothetical protein